MRVLHITPWERGVLEQLAARLARSPVERRYLEARIRACDA